MARPAHDPVQRLNRHHADDVLAVARTFGGHPDASAARVVAITSAGLALVVDAPAGTAEAHIAFGMAMPDLGSALSPRLAFRELARRAHDTRP